MQVKVQMKDYNLKSIIDRPKEDEDNFAQMQQLHRQFFAYLCSVYQFICRTPETSRATRT